MDLFENIARKSYLYTDADTENLVSEHAFLLRDIHTDFPDDVQKLFDDGHYAQAVFEAFKFVDLEVQRISGSNSFGAKLMMQEFGGKNPNISLNAMSDPSDESEQEGYKFLFSGAMQAIRNPRGHKAGVRDTPDACLDYLCFASMLLRKLEQSGNR